MPLLGKQLEENIVHNLTEGVIIIGFDGAVRYKNASASSILEIPEEKLSGKFSSLFADDPRNSAFVRTILNSVSKKNAAANSIVTYYAGEKKKYLRMTASPIRSYSGLGVGFTMVLDDVTEIMELSDTVKALQKINDLNSRLEERNELLSRTFGMFFSDEIVKELLDTPDGLEPGGKKRFLTIMFSDLRGFTGMSEHLPAENLIAMLNHYFGVMTDVIQKYHGTIIEFMGDGIMAIFGAPVLTQTHAADAIAAALAMEGAMDEINRWNLEMGYPEIQMGIGLHTGEVIVGNLGSEKRMKYGVVGNHVNLCSRIESYTVGGQILISPEVRKAAAVPLRIESEMTVIPKGADQEIVLSSVTGIGDPYQLYITPKSDQPRAIRNPIPVCFFRLDGKHTGEKSCFGGIVAIGAGCAVLQTATELSRFDNIQLKAGGRLLCKVMEKNEDSYVLQYTSIPSGYEKWILDMMLE